MNEVVFFENFVAVREELRAPPANQWALTYLIVEKRLVKVIPFFSPANSRLQLTGDKKCNAVKYTVVNVSDSLYHANRSCVVACVRGRNGAGRRLLEIEMPRSGLCKTAVIKVASPTVNRPGSRFARLYHSDLGGATTVRPGTEVVFAESAVRETGSKMFTAKKMELFVTNSMVIDFKAPPVVLRKKDGASTIRGRVYPLGELDAIPSGEAVSLRGVLRQRWLEEDRFSDNLKLARKTELPHIPKWLKLHLKLAADSNAQVGSLNERVPFAPMKFAHDDLLFLLVKLFCFHL